MPFKTAHKRLNNGYSAAHARLKHIIYAVFSRNLKKLGSVRRHKLLVGRDHIFTRREELLCEVVSGSNSAHNLGYRLDFGVA